MTTFQKSDIFTEGEEELEDETTVNGAEEEDDDDDEVGEEEEDHDKSIEFRSEIGSSGKILVVFLLKCIG